MAWPVSRAPQWFGGRWLGSGRVRDPFAFVAGQVILVLQPRGPAAGCRPERLLRGPRVPALQGANADVEFRLAQLPPAQTADRRDSLAEPVLVQPAEQEVGHRPRPTRAGLRLRLP